MIADDLNIRLSAQSSPFVAEQRAGRLVLTLPRGAGANLEQIQAASRILQRSRLGADTFATIAVREDISDAELHRALAAEGLPIAGVSRRAEYPGLLILQAEPDASAEDLQALADRAAVIEALPPPQPTRQQLEDEAVALEKELAAIVALEARGVNVSVRKAKTEMRLAFLAERLGASP